MPNRPAPEAGIERQIKLIGRVLLDRDARGRGLRVVNEHVDAAERFHGFIDYVLHHGLVVRAGVHVSLHDEHLDAVQALQLLLRVLKLFHVAARDNEVRALLGVRGSDAVADGAAGLAVLQDGSARAGDDRGLTSQKTHVKNLLKIRPVRIAERCVQIC